MCVILHSASRVCNLDTLVKETFSFFTRTVIYYFKHDYKHFCNWNFERAVERMLLMKYNAFCLCHPPLINNLVFPCILKLIICKNKIYRYRFLNASINAIAVLSFQINQVILGVCPISVLMPFLLLRSNFQLCLISCFKRFVSSYQIMPSDRAFTLSS